MLPDDVQDEDLSVQGQEDEILDVSDYEEGEEQPSGKAKAAFVKLRQERKALKDELDKTKKVVESLMQQRVTNQQAQQTSDGRGSPAALRRQYRESVRQRAMAALQGESFATEDERNLAVWQEMQAISANDAAQLAMQNLINMQSPQVVESVLNGFSQLDEGDKESIREMIGELPVNLRMDPASIRKEVHSYIGQNFEKFVSTEAPKKEESGAVTPATAKKTTDGRVRLSEMGNAAAAAASGLRGGSPGVRLTEKSGGQKKKYPALTDEDISTMRAQGADPKNPEDVRLFQEAKSLAKRNALGV